MGGRRRSRRRSDGNNLETIPISAATNDFLAADTEKDWRRQPNVGFLVRGGVLAVRRGAGEAR